MDICRDWRLVATRVESQQEPQIYQSLIYALVRKVLVILNVVRKCRAVTAETEAEALLGPYPPSGEGGLDTDAGVVPCG